MRIKRGRGEFTYYAEDIHGDEHELVVTYNGYSDPGVCTGPVERCYAPEGEIEIECDLPAGIDFGDTDKLREKIEEEAWEHLCEERKYAE